MGFLNEVVEFLRVAIDFVLHIDHHLSEIIQQYGLWTYLILFTIVFLETGLVVTPFLPGDSLLFAAGAFAARGALNPVLLFFLLSASGILGDTVNYWIGNQVGPKVFTEGSRFFKREHLLRTNEFYARYGAKTIVLARFIPIIRTFAPFVAGIGAMRYGRFLTYNVLGGVTWVALFVFGGYYFGNLPAVEENFTFVILGIIFLSVLPPVIEYFRHRWNARRPA